MKNVLRLQRCAKEPKLIDCAKYRHIDFADIKDTRKAALLLASRLLAAMNVLGIDTISLFRWCVEGVMYDMSGVLPVKMHDRRYKLPDDALFGR